MREWNANRRRGEVLAATVAARTDLDHALLLHKVLGEQRAAGGAQAAAHARARDGLLRSLGILGVLQVLPVVALVVVKQAAHRTKCILVSIDTCKKGRRNYALVYCCLSEHVAEEDALL